MFPARTLTFLVMATGVLTSVMAYTVEDINRLLSDKTENYNKKVRPVFHQNKTVTVVMQMELLTIKDFDEVSGKFAISAVLILFWKDELVQWNPAEYGNLYTFSAVSGDFWRPPIVLLNPFDSLANIGADWEIVRHLSNGDVYVTPGAILEVSCAADVSYYPWDEHTCDFIFNSWGYTTNEVKLTVPNTKVGLLFTETNGQWDIIETYATSYVDMSYSSYTSFSIKIKRKPMFILVNSILPVVIISFLNMLVFWIPTESGERISYCLTVLLSLAVFLTLVGDTLPKTSNPMSYLSYYLLALLVESVCIVLATVLSLRIYFHDVSTPVPKWLAVIVRILGCKCKTKGKSALCKNSMNYDDRKGHYNSCCAYTVHDRSQCLIPNKPYGHATQDHEQNAINVLHNALASNQQDSWSLKITDNGSIPQDDPCHPEKEKKKTALTKSEKEDGGVNVTWKDVSTAMDFLSFFFFFIMLTSFTTIFFVVIQTRLV